jgi:hypothetical protein
MAKMKVLCAYQKLVPIGKLKPHPKNRNSHPKKQIELLAAILKERGWRHPIIVSKKSGLIVAGHGRLEAAKVAGFTEVPVDYQAFENADQEYEFLVADNAVALWSELDLEGIAEDLKGFNIDLSMLGVQDFMDGINLSGQAAVDLYTKKIQSPIYTPKGSKPKVEELYDVSKADKLVKKIHAAKLPKEIEMFLKAAALRHTVFDYENIAEYYCHATKEVQELMEDSALVIIDFRKAIEKGFVVLTDEIAEQFTND